MPAPMTTVRGPLKVERPDWGCRVSGAIRSDRIPAVAGGMARDTRQQAPRVSGALAKGDSEVPRQEPGGGPAGVATLLRYPDVEAIRQTFTLIRPELGVALEPVHRVLRSGGQMRQDVGVDVF